MRILCGVSTERVQKVVGKGRSFVCFLFLVSRQPAAQHMRSLSSLVPPSYSSRLLIPQDDDISNDDFDIIDGSLLSVQHTLTVTRPPSPTLSVDFSIVSPPSPGPDRNSYPFTSHTGRSRTRLFPPSRDKRYNTVHGSSSSHRALLTSVGNRTPQNSKSMKCLLPRLWGALSSPTRKGRRKAGRRKPYALPSNVSYADLLPLDGEEGELVDEDEACYVDSYDTPQSPSNSTGLFAFCRPHTFLTP